MKNREYRRKFQSWQHVVDNYGGNCPAKEPRFVFGEYETPSYEGYSTVITSDDGKQFTVVEGSHCSCYGLEGQWRPTHHAKDEIEKMLDATWGFFKDNRDDLQKWLKHVAR